MSKVVKKKSLFDHINQITSVQNPNYWDEISDEDKKSWSNYMVNRFLSMKTDWIELVNELQKYNLKPKELYKLYTNVLPKGKRTVCSPDCHFKYYRIPVTCSFCHVGFYLKRSEVAQRYKRRYNRIHCSRICYNKDRRDR